ncbi:MAG: tetratricopeptide repeat protein [Alphaproteobacteria bacterium]|nr:tetratricopeptide repeat protein [Alphaproteobacteria bacterium]
MRVWGVRVAVAAVGLVWLAGCETTSGPDNPFRKLTDSLPAFPAAAPADDVTGSIEARPGTPPGPPPLSPELLGSDPHDDVSVGKKYFRQGSYGLAERHFRLAVERHPRDAEAWVGLAASYDRLKRFDLADRSYAQAIKVAGPTPEILNNQGFSYMLRGDYARARSTLRAAQARDPENPYIQNNLRLLDESQRKGRAIN